MLANHVDQTGHCFHRLLENIIHLCSAESQCTRYRDIRLESVCEGAFSRYHADIGWLLVVVTSV